MKRNLPLEAEIVKKYAAVSPVLNERGRRLWAAAEARSIGYGGDALVSSATGLARETIRNGRREIERGVQASDRVRGPGGGRPGIDETQPGIREALERLVDPLTRGDPGSPLRWTCKSRAKLAGALTERGWRVSSTTVGRVLNELGYRLQSVRKSREGAAHPDRNAQFEHINATAEHFLSDGEPVISVDTKKKELVGDFRNAGREWQPQGEPERALVHDFPSDGLGKAIPYGIYDMARNEAWVSVGRDHDTPAFAVASIRQWWQMMGHQAYPEAQALFITADAGGSNGYRSRTWKHALQHFADETGLRIRVSHFPPGTSKWNSATSEGWHIQQERESCRGKSQSPVARIAGWRETETLKPIDKAIVRMAASHQAVTKVNAQVASKMRPRRSSPLFQGEGSMRWRTLTKAPEHSGGVLATAWWQGCAKQLEKPSSSRREIGGSWVGRITGSTGKSADGERVEDGSVVAMKRSNVRGARGPCCL